MKLEMLIEDRKQLVSRLGELTGMKPEYLKMPTCAYQIGPYNVARDGSLTVDEDQADVAVLEALADEGLVQQPVGIEAKEERAQEMEPLQPVFVFPTAQHTARSLRNLVRIYYSRAELLNRATGSCFAVDKRLITFIQNGEKSERSYADQNDPLHLIESYASMMGESGLTGIEIGRDEIRITGFPPAPDGDHVHAWTQLASALNQHALSMKGIQVKEIDLSNEKYAMKSLLDRVGLGGTEYRQTRKLLMENLTGCIAFKTQAQTERFQEKRRQQRREKGLEKEQRENAPEPLEAPQSGEC